MHATRNAPSDNWKTEFLPMHDSKNWRSFNFFPNESKKARQTHPHPRIDMWKIPRTQVLEFFQLLSWATLECPICGWTLMFLNLDMLNFGSKTVERLGENEFVIAEEIDASGSSSLISHGDMNVSSVDTNEERLNVRHRSSKTKSR